MPRRRQGTLLPLEMRILDSGLRLQTPEEGFHGFLLASALKDTDDASSLTGHGTLYKALGRMAERGLLDAAWEDPSIAEAAGRPRRRLYRVTGDGAVALAAARAEKSEVIAGVPSARAAGGLG
jgi:PadR family transcriptional regulator, regulatory protein PadR